MTHSMTFTVRPAVQLVSLAIDVEKTELKINERIAASVKGTYADGKVASISKGVKWKSADTTIAEVNPDGELVAHKSGKVDITAVYGTVESAPLRLTVVEEAPKLVALRPQADKRELKVGEAQPVKLFAKYSDGKEQEVVTGVGWKSSDESVAEVISQGEGRAVVIGRSAGRAIIVGIYERRVSSRLAFAVIDAVAGKRKENGEAVLLGRYSVIRSAAVYREPRPDSNVITKLGPGTIVNVVGGSGDYLRIESRLGNPPGYVLRLDVEPAEATKDLAQQQEKYPVQRRIVPVIKAREANSRSESVKLALADCSQGGEGCRIIRAVCTTKKESPQYGAIAYSSTRQAHGYSVDYPDQRSAQTRALKECGTDCKIALWFRDACAALAVGQRR